MRNLSLRDGNRSNTPSINLTLTWWEKKHFFIFFQTVFLPSHCLSGLPGVVLSGQPVLTHTCTSTHTHWPYVPANTNTQGVDAHSHEHRHTHTHTERVICLIERAFRRVIKFPNDPLRWLHTNPAFRGEQTTETHSKNTQLLPQREREGGYISCWQGQDKHWGL